MNTAELWENENAVTDLGLDVPEWIEQDISPYDIAAIVQGGCASGAYMPAVTYHQALATMSESGDDVMDFIEQTMGELPSPPDSVSWSGLAVFYLSVAVELWAAHAESELEELDDD